MEEHEHIAKQQGNGSTIPLPHGNKIKKEPSLRRKMRYEFVSPQYEVHIYPTAPNPFSHASAKMWISSFHGIASTFLCQRFISRFSIATTRFSQFSHDITIVRGSTSSQSIVGARSPRGSNILDTALSILLLVGASLLFFNDIKRRCRSDTAIVLLTFFGQVIRRDLNRDEGR